MSTPVITASVINNGITFTCTDCPPLASSDSYTIKYSMLDMSGNTLPIKTPYISMAVFPFTLPLSQINDTISSLAPSSSSAIFNISTLVHDNPDHPDWYTVVPLGSVTVNNLKNPVPQSGGLKNTRKNKRSRYSSKKSKKSKKLNFKIAKK